MISRVRHSMDKYSGLEKLVLSLDLNSSEDGFLRSVVPYLTDIWLSDYARYTSTMDVVETRASNFSYLFDINAERLITAWGLSRGRHSGPRDRTAWLDIPKVLGRFTTEATRSLIRSAGSPISIWFLNLAALTSGLFALLRSKRLPHRAHSILRTGSISARLPHAAAIRATRGQGLIRITCSRGASDREASPSIPPATHLRVLHTGPISARLPHAAFIPARRRQGSIRVYSSRDNRHLLSATTIDTG